MKRLFTFAVLALGVFASGVGSAISWPGASSAAAQGGSATLARAAGLFSQRELTRLGSTRVLAVGRPAHIDSAVASEGHVSLAWSLPTGTQSRHVGISTSPATASDGSFSAVIESANLAGSTTSYVSAVLPAGIYYAHVLVYDPLCACRVWSDIVSAEVPAAPPPATTTTDASTTSAGTTATTSATVSTSTAVTTSAAATTSTTAPAVTAPLVPPSRPPATSRKPAKHHNHAPTLTWSFLRVRPGVSNSFLATFHLTLCDDTDAGRIHVSVKEVLTKHGNSSSRVVTSKDVREVDGCRGTVIRWTVGRALLAKGSLIVVSRLRDSEGVFSNTVRVPIR